MHPYCEPCNLNLQINVYKNKEFSIANAVQKDGVGKEVKQKEAKSKEDPAKQLATALDSSNTERHQSINNRQ